MTRRKTIEVWKVRDWCQNILDAPHTSRDERKAAAFILEEVLLETYNYKGFAYTDEEDDTRRRYL